MLTPLKDWRFWLNYVFSLGLTIWIPLAQLEFRMEQTGEVVNTSTLPMYRIYWELAQHPGTNEYYKYVALHLGGVFLITALVWVLLVRPGAPRAQA